MRGGERERGRGGDGDQETERERERERQRGRGRTLEPVEAGVSGGTGPPMRTSPALQQEEVSDLIQHNLATVQSSGSAEVS